MSHSSTRNLLIGAHISTSGGFYKAIERAASIGCTTMQIFTKSNRQWQASSLTADDIRLFKHAQKQCGIAPIVAHASYLINIGSPNPETEKKSIEALIIELQRCELLGITYLVLHPGSHTNTDEVACLDRIARNLSDICNAVPGSTQILLETTAGQGSATCYRFEHIAHIIAKVMHERIGVCIDTCHIFAAGYDFRTPATYLTMWNLFDTIVGKKYLKVIHMNDSKKDLGSRVDRHEEIGKGKIGLIAFELLMKDPTLAHVAKIVETPIEKTETALADHKRNIDILKNLT